MIAPHPKIVRLALLVGVPMLVAAVGLVFWMQGGRTVSTENAYVKADIAQIAPEVSGRVAEVLVHDHEAVEAGTALVRLDRAAFQLALDKAEAELETARMTVETTRATYHETRSELGEVESQAGFMTRQATRQQDLARHGVVSTTKLEEADNNAVVARDRVSVMRKRLERLLTGLNGNPDLPIDQHALVREKRAARDSAALDLARTTITAPLGGIAVNVKLQPGDQVKVATPIFVLVANKRPWVEANMKETDLTYVRVGQKAKVALDIYPEASWDATVDSISPATGAEFAILPPQNASGNWVKVVQRLPLRVALIPHQGEPPLRAGMTATVTIDTGRQRSLPGFLAGLLPGTASASGPQASTR